MRFTLLGYVLLFIGLMLLTSQDLFSQEDIQEELEAMEEMAEVEAEAEAEGIDLEEGREIFRTQCASCHNRNMVDDLTGPALGGVQERWADYPIEDLRYFIRYSQRMIEEGHPKAVEIWDEWAPAIMNNFPNLTDGEIDNILAYVDAVYKGEYGVPDVAVREVGEVEEEERDNTFLLISLIVILTLFALILARIANVLRSIHIAKETGQAPEPGTIMSMLTSKTVIGLVLFAVIVLGGYTTVNNAIDLGRQQNYAPQQPIEFSHAVHAGLHEIDCQYCHDAARRSKNALIPPTSTCMNCHTAIKIGSEHGTAELVKIFASIGFDPANDEYIENYEEMPMDEVAAIYKRWIEEQYVRENELDYIDAAGRREVDRQWENVVSSLTHEDRDHVAGPIEWVRVHNLPDHVYFNHAQHVVAGNVDCQTCHGKVEEMEVLAQYSTLSMGWCINCHRQTEVQGFADGNEYYMQAYQKYHDALSRDEMDRVTVEDIGGLQCQACHY
ncbi:MAG: cytochrome c class I [Saprospirales bacterium]|nr:MAG: cytochrome c class I [Saprospirales bacterium]